MSNNSTETGSYLSGNYYAFNGNVLLTALVIVVFVLTAYIMLQCLNRCLVTGHVMTDGILYHLSSVDLTNYRPQSTRSNFGLHPSVVAAIPVVAYQKGWKEKDTDGDGLVDCVVCLGQLEEGEKVRVLPRCQHLFHVDCIDMWLFSHSTCPVCRANAEPPDSVRSPGSLSVIMAGLFNAKEVGSTSSPAASVPQTVNRDLSGAHPSIEAVQDLERQ